jgi:hypothetical protein
VFLKGDNKSDCEQFFAHCLDIGGIKIKNTKLWRGVLPVGQGRSETEAQQSLVGLRLRSELLERVTPGDQIMKWMATC